METNTPKGDHNMVVRWAVAINEATCNIHVDENKLGWDHDEFSEVAQALVDGTIEELGGDTTDAEAYMNFMENDSENWWHWIDQHIGTDWGKVAKVIHEEGY